MPEIKVGTIIHYFAKVGAALIQVTEGELSVGDRIHIKGRTTDHTQTVPSLQIERQAVEKIVKGQEAGMKVEVRVHERDEVFRVVD
jgi:putative protease